MKKSNSALFSKQLPRIIYGCVHANTKHACIMMELYQEIQKEEWETNQSGHPSGLKANFHSVLHTGPTQVGT